MKKFATVYALWFLVIAIVLVMALAMATHPAAAQTETPTVTPETSEIVEIDGNYLKLDYTVTLGDMAIVIGGLLISGTLTIYTIVRIVTTYIR